MTAARLTLTDLQSPEQTAGEMVRLVKTYCKDIGERAKWPIVRFFDFVRNLEYRADPLNNETISRPAFLLQENWPARDCDDKSILLASWCECNGVPWKFVAKSDRPDCRLHHVYVMACFKGKWKTLDATYKKCQFGAELNPEKTTRKKDLTGVIMPTLSVLEGSEMGFSLKSVKKGIKKGARIATKPVASTVRATKKMGTAVKSGSVTKIARATKNVALAPARDVGRNVKTVASALGKVMPAAIKRNIKAGLKKAFGSKVTAATKAAIVPSATALALAVPGVQPFAAAVPVVVSVALDEIIKEGKGIAARNVKKAIAKPVATAKKAIAKPMATAKKAIAKPVATVKTPMDKAKERAAALRSKMQEAKAAAVPAIEETAAAAGAAAVSKKKVLVIGGTAAAVILYLAMKPKKRMAGA